MSSIVHLTSVHQPFDHRVYHKECRSLARAGYEVTLVAPSDGAIGLQEGVQILTTARPKPRYRRPLTWWRLLRQTIRLRPDLVHFHDPELLLIAPLFRLRLGPQLKIVYDVHEYFVDSIAQKVWIPPLLRKPAATFSQALERHLGRVVDGLVFVIEEQVPLYTGWPAAQVVVHNYPEVAAFSNPRPISDLSPDRFRLIYIGSLYARRGIMTMLQALAQVVPQAPETLLILGGAFDDPGFRVQADAFIAEHHLENHVIFLGWVDHGRLQDYLASADVGWLPGLEGKQYERRSISTKQLEYMLMGLPIVCGDHPSLRVFVEQSGGGFVVAADDPMEHAQAILWLYRHPQSRREMGARGRQLVLERFTWETEASYLLSFYEQLLSRQQLETGAMGDREM